LLWRCDPTRVMASSFLRFLDHTQRRTTVGRIPLDEWSARRRDLYLTTYNRHPFPRWDSNPRSQRASGANLRLRPRGHWDRHFCLDYTWLINRFWLHFHRFKRHTEVGTWWRRLGTSPRKHHLRVGPLHHLLRPSSFFRSRILQSGTGGPCRKIYKLRRCEWKFN